MTAPRIGYFASPSTFGNGGAPTRPAPRRGVRRAAVRRLAAGTIAVLIPVVISLTHAEGMPVATAMFSGGGFGCLVGAKAMIRSAVADRRPINVLGCVVATVLLAATALVCAAVLTVTTGIVVPDLG